MGRFIPWTLTWGYFLDGESQLNSLPFCMVASNQNKGRLQLTSQGIIC